MWPIRPDQITLRACEDFRWQVMASCPNCGHAISVNLRILAGSKYGAEPVYRLLERGTFKHRNQQRGCDGVKADRVSISSMDVGLLRTIAEWVVLPGGSSARLVTSELPRGGSPI